MKKILFLCVCLCSLMSVSANAAPKVSDILTDSITYASRNLKYAYYVPKDTSVFSEALILVPGLNGQGKGMITPEWKQLADEKKWLIIAPTFVFEGGKAFNNQQSYQYPRAWSGEALNMILKQFSEKGNYINSLYMAGFSAGAQFVGRYIFLYPEKVKKAAILSSGGNDAITKRIPVKIFYGIGEKDSKDRKFFAEKFIREAKNHSITITDKTYAKTGHKLTKEMKNDAIEFMRND